MAFSSHLQIPWKQPRIYLQEAGYQESFLQTLCMGEEKEFRQTPSSLQQQDLIVLETASKHGKQTKLHVYKHERKIMCINTEPSLQSLQVRQCSFSPKLVCDAEISMCLELDSWNSPRMTKYHSQCFLSITCTVYLISALNHPCLPAYTSSGPVRNT